MNANSGIDALAQSQNLSLLSYPICRIKLTLRTQNETMNPHNLFHRLGLTHEATQAEIKIAYKKLATEFHPDRNTDPNAEERFKEINEAYSVLSDFYLRLLHEKELGLSKSDSEIPTPTEPETEQEEKFQTDEEPLQKHFH